MIDTHCHLGDPAFDADRAEVAAMLGAAGVSRAVVVESDPARFDTTLAWVQTTAGMGLATGFHPHDAASWSSDLAQELWRRWSAPLVVAAGEMGLDYHYDHSPRARQQEAFAAQLELACRAGLPAVIHAREADDDVVAILRAQPAATIILHSFSSTATLRDAGLDAGWYFSFSGMITFKSWTQHDTLRAVPADRLLIETDSPYLAPVPHRGGRNHPGLVIEVARELARVRDVSLQEMADATTANALRVFARLRDIPPIHTVSEVR